MKETNNKLVLVPTPIGNLKDISLRALETLKDCDLILTEDTRKTGMLLKHFDIKKTLIPHHKFNEHNQVHKIVERIISGEKVVLVSDAGTPAISDPGYLITKTCIENDIDVECLPGATAFVPAIVNSGLPNDRFCFEGFLPQKKGRKKRIEALIHEERTIVLYESPYRITKLLNEIKSYMGEDREVSVSREISKIHEETLRGKTKELIAHFEEKQPKGEFVVVIKGK